MDFSDVDRINILQNLLNERYNASHKMRERSLKFTLWVFGYFVLSNGWLIINGTTLSADQRLAFTFLALMVAIFTFFFIRDIERGFNNNRTVMINVEKAFEFYDKDKYLQSEQVLPDEYKNKSKSKGRGHFATLYVWIVFTCLLTIIVIWLGYFQMHESKENMKSGVELKKNDIQINNK